MGNPVGGLFMSATTDWSRYYKPERNVVVYENENLPFTPEQGDIYVYPSVDYVELYHKERADYEECRASWGYLTLQHRIKHNLCYRNTERGVQAAKDRAKAMLMTKE